MHHTELKILLIDHDREFVQACLKSDKIFGWSIFASDRIEDAPSLLLRNHCQVCIVSDADWDSNGISRLIAHKKKTPELLVLSMAEKDANDQLLKPHAELADGAILRPLNPGAGLIDAVRNMIASKKRISSRSLEQLLDLLHEHSLRLSQNDVWQDFSTIALDGIAHLGSADRCGFILRHHPGKPSDMIYEQGEPRLGDRLLAALHAGGLDQHPSPFILQVENVMDAAVSTFSRKNKFKSLLIVPLHRNNYDLWVWAARNEQNCEFIHAELITTVIFTTQMAMAIEKPAFYWALVEPAGPAELSSLAAAEPLLTANASQQPGICEPKRNYILQNMQAEHPASSGFHGHAIRFLEKKRVITNGVTTIHLTLTEARLFGVLWQRRNELASHIELVYLTHGYQVNAEEASKILRPVVSRLKKKLSAFDGGEQWIKNVRGTGYTMEDI